MQPSMKRSSLRVYVPVSAMASAIWHQDRNRQVSKHFLRTYGRTPALDHLPAEQVAPMRPADSRLRPRDVGSCPGRVGFKPRRKACPHN
jgi:hypothetical protein